MNGGEDGAYTYAAVTEEEGKDEGRGRGAVPTARKADDPIC